MNYNGTRVGTNITYYCNDGYRPAASETSTCVVMGVWVPLPQEHICTLIEGIAIMVTVLSVEKMGILHEESVLEVQGFIQDFFEKRRSPPTSKKQCLRIQCFDTLWKNS